MAETLDRTESIFAAAVALPTTAERIVLLDRECANDPGLRGRIEALLFAHDRAGHLLDRPVPGGLDQTQAYIPREQPGALIAGRYKLLEKIGEGGMGAVWMVEQTEPVRRKVALKLIKAGMDSKSVLARFDAERQALAVMDHPNIAKVLDGGLTESGRPFFVMEYVKGVPITEYCDATRMSIPERLQLFAQVCQAVQHAHQKGIIHRDLKPSNILVAPYDDKPVPKVIDFGLAKAMHQSLTEQTLHTAHETVLGTPLYMSPEQAQLNNIDVDTRSDIYSLGVLLYELLTGTTPLEKQRFKVAAWEEVKRIIREEEPPRPSARLSSTSTLPSLAAGRQIDPARLTKLVRGELDWIVMKSLEKDRARRYETATGFAADVQRYLDGEPVLAAPPSARYRLRKFARKHRAILITAATIVSLLVTGVAVSSWQAVRAMRAETAAQDSEREAVIAQRAEAERAKGERQAKQKALAAVAAERTAREQAQKRLIQIEKSNEIMTSIFTDLDIKKVKAGPDPLEAVLAKRLVRVAEQLEGEAVGDPLIVAGLQDRLGTSLTNLGYAPEAIPLFVKALATQKAKLGTAHPSTLKSMGNLATGYQDAGKLDLALPLQEETLKLKKANLGAEHPDTLLSMNNLAACYQAVGKLDLALPLYEQTLKLKKATLGAAHFDTLMIMNNLATCYHDAGKLDLALPLYEETLKLKKATLGADHPETLTSMNNLALAYPEAGKLDLAVSLLEETLKLRQATLGTDHPDTLNSMANLAMGYQVSGKLDLSLTLMEKTLKLLKAKLGEDHPKTLVSMNNLAGGYLSVGKVDLALPLLEETLRLTTAKLGADHPNTLKSMGMLAGGYYDAGKRDLALPLFEKTLKLSRAKLGDDHPATLECMDNLAGAYQVAGKLELALSIFREAALGVEKRGFQDLKSSQIVQGLITCHERLKQFDQAETWRRKWLAEIKNRAGADSAAYSNELSGLGMNLMQQKKWVDAEAALRESLAFGAKQQPEHLAAFLRQSLLGGALLSQKKYADAEPLLLAGYIGMKKLEAQIPPQGQFRLAEALDWLITLYTATDKPDEVKKWQAERSKYPPLPVPLRANQ